MYRSRMTAPRAAKLASAARPPATIRSLRNSWSSKASTVKTDVVQIGLARRPGHDAIAAAKVQHDAPVGTGEGEIAEDLRSEPVPVRKAGFGRYAGQVVLAARVRPQDRKWQARGGRQRSREIVRNADAHRRLIGGAQVESTLMVEVLPGAAGASRSGR